MSVVSTAKGRAELASPEPRRRVRRRRLWIGVGLGLLVLLLAAATWAVGFSSLLTTRQVQVHGVDALTEGEVGRAAKVALGRPLARQDLDRIARDVAELRPVRSVRVERTWPRTLTIRVTERTPVIAIQRPDGVLLLDAEGVGYLTVPSAPKGVVRADVDPTQQALVADVAEVAGALPKKLRADVSAIEARSPSAIVVVLDSGVRVRWGTAADSELKATITRALLKRTPRTIDVSAPHHPAST
ncbi:MAG: cell division protein FtsQ/DivIB [Actinomycetes bacterium]